MNRKCRIVCALALGLLSSSASFAQEIGGLLKQSLSDGTKLVNAYVSPFAHSFTLGLNQGWYNTAAPHKVGGFDLTITANAMFIPKSDLFYNVNELNLEVLQIHESSPDYPMAPTVFGPDRSPVFAYDDNGQEIIIEDIPGGIDLKDAFKNDWLPVPMANIGVGLPKGTEVKLRFAPTIDLDDDGSAINVFGIGVMHNIKQWIPGMKLLPFDLSGFVGYTRVKLDAYFDPEVNPTQHGVFEANATTIQALASKKFAILTLYGGFGYNIAKTNLAVKGEYDIDENGQLESYEIDPLDLKFTSSGFRGTAGLRIKLGILTLHGDYTVQKYSCFTAGLGFSFR